MSRRQAEADERELLALALEEGYCPACGKPLTAPGYGSGSLSDGLFCSLRCFGDYWYKS